MYRTFIAALFLLFLALPAQAATLKIATLSPDGTTLTNELRAAAKEIKAATEGRVTMKVYAGGVMGSDAQVLRKMRVGQLHGGILSAGSLSHIDYNAGILAMPMLITDYAQADAARAAVEADIIKLLATKGYRSSRLMEVGFVYVMGNVPVAARTDMLKAKPWLPEGNEVGRDMFEAFGVAPIALPVPDVLTALQTGTVDTVLCSPVVAVALQWFTRIKHITPAPLLYGYGSLVLANKPLDKLSEADQKTVMDIINTHMDVVDKWSRVSNDEALVALQDQGITLVQINSTDYAEIKQVADELVDRYRDRGDLDPALLSRIRAAVQTASE